MHETFYFRAPTVSDARTDIKNALESAGLDPYELAFVTDEDGNDRFSTTFVHVAEAGTWYQIEPTYDEQKDEYTGGEVGDHCLVTARFADEAHKEVARSFAATDPKKEPSKVDVSKKAANGTSRINEPATPIRPIAE